MNDYAVHLIWSSFSKKYLQMEQTFSNMNISCCSWSEGSCESESADGLWTVMEGFIHWTVFIFISANKMGFFVKDVKIRFSPWLCFRESKLLTNWDIWTLEGNFCETMRSWKFLVSYTVIACSNWTVYQEKLYYIHSWGFSRQSHLKWQAGLRGYFLAIFL